MLHRDGLILQQQGRSRPRSDQSILHAIPTRQVVIMADVEPRIYKHNVQLGAEAVHLNNKRVG